MPNIPEIKQLQANLKLKEKQLNQVIKNRKRFNLPLEDERGRLVPLAYNLWYYRVWFDAPKKHCHINCPSLEDIINLCILFNIPFNQTVLTEVYNNRVPNSQAIQVTSVTSVTPVTPTETCDICLEDKQVIDNMFLRFLKRDTDNNWIKSCDCRVLVCHDCCMKLNNKCPMCRVCFSALTRLTQSKIKMLRDGEQNWNV